MGNVACGRGPIAAVMPANSAFGLFGLPELLGHLQVVRHDRLDRRNELFQLRIGSLASRGFEGVKHVLVVCNHRFYISLVERGSRLFLQLLVFLVIGRLRALRQIYAVVSHDRFQERS